MPLYADTGTPYDPTFAANLTRALQADPWKAEADQRKQAIQSRGGQWGPDDYQFFGLQPGTSEAWKAKYLGNIDQLAAQRISQGAGLGNFNTGKYTIDPSGQVGQRTSFVDSPLGKVATLGPMIAGGGLAAASALGGGGAAIPETLGGQGSVAGGSVGEGLGSAGYMGGEVGAGGAPLTAQAADLLQPGTVAGSGIMSSSAGGASLMGPLLNTGLRLGSALIGSQAAKSAAAQQQANIQKGLDLQANLYGQSRQALMPYYQLGAGSLGRLGSFLGTSPAPPIPAGNLGSLGQAK